MFFACINGFNTDKLPCNHKLFEKTKKKHRVTISFLKQEIKRRKPDFKGLSNKKADELVSILKKDDMKLPSEDKSFVESQEKACRESLERLIEESTSNSPGGAKPGNITNDDRFCLIEAMLCDESKQKLASSQECLSRQQLDARNSAVRIMDHFETVADVFNRETFTPHSISIPGLHPDLEQGRPLPLGSCRMSSSNAKDEHNQMKNKLHGIISDWEMGVANVMAQIPTG